MNVLDVLRKSKSPVDVSILVEKLKVNKTTVYRQVEKLLKNNLIIELEFGDGKKRYELKDENHHHHLICNRCGRLEDIKLNEEIIIKDISNKTNFKIESHSLEFFGLCVNCK